MTHQPITISLLRGTNSLYLTCGERQTYIEIAEPGAFATLIHIVTNWTSRGLATPSEAVLSAKEVEILVAEYREAHKGDLTDEELKDLFP